MNERICIVTALHGRPELTSIVLKYYAALAKTTPLMLVAVGSSHEERVMAHECGWKFVSHYNIPLSHKFTRVFRAAQLVNPDLVVLVGSDDLLHPDLLAYYKHNHPPDAPYLLGLEDLYFYSSVTGKAIHHHGFIGNKAGYSIGCGRVFSRALLDRIDWKPWGSEKINRGLDLTCSRMLKRMGIEERTVKMCDSGVAVDIKTAIGLTRMETFNFNYSEINPLLLEQAFPSEWPKIKALSRC